MIATLLQGISIGFAAGMTPGPLQIFLITETLQFGWRHAIWLVFSPLIVDGPIVALILLVLQQASDNLLRGISLFGGAFVLYLAWGLWKQLRRNEAPPEVSAETSESRGSVLRALRKALAITALSPGPWLFWGTAMGPIVIAAWRDAPPSALTLVLGFYGTFLGIMAVQVILFHQARRMGPHVVRRALWIGLVAMLAFAFSLWWRVLAG